jgi:hypothetical protein
MVEVGLRDPKFLARPLSPVSAPAWSPHPADRFHPDPSSRETPCSFFDLNLLHLDFSDLAFFFTI